MFNRRSPVSLKPQRVGQVVVGGGEVGPKPDRFAEVEDGLVHDAQVDQRCPEITVVFRMIGLKPQGGLIGADRAIKLPERPERLGEGGVISRLGGADRDRPAHKRGRPTGISPLERDQPQEVESLGMLRRLSQGRLIQARGLLEPVLPMVLDRRAQIDRHGPGSSGRVIWTERPGEFDITSPPSYAEGLEVDAGRTGWVETADRSPSRGAILGMVIRPDHAPVGGAFRARLSARC